MDQESIDPARGQHAPEDPIAEPFRYDGPAASEAEPRPAAAEQQTTPPAADTPQSQWQPGTPPVADAPQWQPSTPASYAPPSGWQTGQQPQGTWQQQPTAGWQQPTAPVANLPQSQWQPGGDAQPGQFPPMAAVAQPVQQVWPAPAEPWHPPLVANADLPPGWHAPLRADLVPVAPRKRRSKRLMLIAAAVVVLLVAGVTTWLVWPPDRSPFEQAVANLAAQPVANYQAELAPGTEFDGRVTKQGDAVGHFNADSLKFPFLIVNGRMYVQLSDGLLPADLGALVPSSLNMKDRWATGDVAVVGSLFKQAATPAAIATQLRDQVARTDKLPAPSDEGTTVNGIPVLKADTPDGTLYVAKNQPYQVVRWIDKTTKKAAAFTDPGRKLRLNGARAADSYTGLGTATFTPMTDDDVDKTYDEMETDVGQLANAINAGITLTDRSVEKPNNFQACIPTGCPITMHFTVTPAPGQSVPPEVTVQLDATATLNELDAGSCTTTAKVSSTGPGSLTCVDKDMQAAFDQAKAKSGGGEYLWFVSALFKAYVVPLASVDTVAEGKRLESMRPDHACGWTDKGGTARDPISLKGDFTARLDTARFPDFEIHVFQKGKSYGDFGPSGWIAKNGAAVPTNVPAELTGDLKAAAVKFMKAQGTLKDGDNTDGDAWKRPAPKC